jgi:hypothetical protein
MSDDDDEDRNEAREQPRLQLSGARAAEDEISGEVFARKSRGEEGIGVVQFIGTTSWPCFRSGDWHLV